MAERSRVRRPLEERIAGLERKVITDEERLAAVNQALCDTSAEGGGEAIAGLSREMEQLRARIDQQFEELHRLSTEHAEREAELARQLEEVE